MQRTYRYDVVPHGDRVLSTFLLFFNLACICQLSTDKEEENRRGELTRNVLM